MNFITSVFIVKPFLFSFILIPSVLHAAWPVTNQSVKKRGNVIVIQYDLPEEEKFTTTLEVSLDGGTTFDFTPRYLTGDIGPDIAGRGRKIVWEFEKEGVVFDNGILFNMEAFSQRFEMVPVPGGCFDMGDTFGEGWSTEKPVHKVCVGDFYLSAHEVTQGEWKRVMKKNPAGFNTCGDSCPVESVSFYDVRSFLRALNEETGRDYRLPTEAEWEYAARNGGKKVRFGTGKDILADRDANFNADSVFQESYSERGVMRGETLAVGSFPPNSLALYDMAGNVWEWLNDQFIREYYEQSTIKYQPDSGKEAFVVIRGGGWNDKPKSLRNSRRSRVSPGYKSNDLGFRLAVTKL